MPLAEAAPQDAGPSFAWWLIAAATLCLPATVYVLHRLWHWWVADEAIPLPEGRAFPASRLPAPYGLVLFGTMFLGSILIGLIYTTLAAEGFLPWETSEGPRPLSPLGFVMTTVPAGLGLAVVLQFGRGVAGSLGVRLGRIGHGVRLGLLGAASSLPVCVIVLVVTFAFLALFGAAEQVQEHPTLKALRQMREPWALAATLLQASVLAPLGEEFMYRGVLQVSLLKYVGVRGALVTSAALFAAAHLSAAPQTVPSLFVLGLALGYLAYRTRSLVAPIVCHAAFNTLMVLGMYFGGG